LASEQLQGKEKSKLTSLPLSLPLGLDMHKTVVVTVHCFSIAFIEVVLTLQRPHKWQKNLTLEPEDDFNGFIEENCSNSSEDLVEINWMNRWTASVILRNLV